MQYDLGIYYEILIFFLEMEGEEGGDEMEIMEIAEERY